jgi:hypothetical protein
MRKLLNRKIVEQNRICAICQFKFADYNDVIPDHENPKGWEARRETIIEVTSEPCTGSAILKKDRQGRTSEGRSAMLNSMSNRVMKVVTTH